MTDSNQKQLGKSFRSIAACLSSLHALITAGNQNLESTTTQRKFLVQQLSATSEEVTG